MLKVESEEKNILFTGDFDTRDSPLTKGAKPTNVDTVFIEGTYGGRNHPNLVDETKRFIDEIIRVTDEGGTVLVLLANGRTQDMLIRLTKTSRIRRTHRWNGKIASYKWKTQKPKESKSLNDVELRRRYPVNR